MKDNEKAAAHLFEMLGIDKNGKPPELSAELVPYVQECPALGFVLRHPLCYSAPYAPAMARFCNSQFEQKRKHAERAYFAGDWVNWLAIHEKPYRIAKLAELVDDGCLDIETAEFWRVFFEVYIGSENWQESRDIVDGWLENAEGFREIVAAGMYEDERREWSTVSAFAGKALPVARGWSRWDGERGYSWTVDRDKAGWFASRLVDKSEGESAAVAFGTVDPKDVFGYFSRRGESEVFVPWYWVAVDFVERPQVSRREGRPWIAYDFDGVLHSSMQPGESRHPQDFVTWGLSERSNVLNRLRIDSRSASIAIVTARDYTGDGFFNAGISPILRFCEHHGLPVRRVICTGGGPKAEPLAKLAADGGLVAFYDDQQRYAAEVPEGCEFRHVDRSFGGFKTA